MVVLLHTHLLFLDPVHVSVIFWSLKLCGLYSLFSSFFFCLAFSWVGWTVGGPCRKDLVLPMVRRHFSVGRKLGFFSLCI